MAASLSRCALLALVSVLALLLFASVAHAQGPTPDATAWILIDANDGEVLAEHNADDRMPIASTTKLMTARVAIDGLDPSQTVTVGGYAGDPVESLMGLLSGDRVTVEDLLYGLLLPSGNDAAVALAEATSGSVDAFVLAMNAEARALELSNTSYANPIGLDDPDNYSTARDLARLAIALREDELFSRIVDTPRHRATAGGRTLDLVNRNNLVLDVPWVDGVKTGRTLTAGNILVASGEQDDVELVSVVLGAGSEETRDAGALALLEYGFDQYKERRVVEKGEELDSVAVAYREDALPAIAARNLRLSLRDDQEIEVRLRDVPEEVRSSTEGEKLGRAAVFVGNDRRGTVNVLAAATFAPPTMLDKANSFLPGPDAVIWLIAVVGLLLLVLVSSSVWGRSS